MVESEITPAQSTEEGGGGYRPGKIGSKGKA